MAAKVKGDTGQVLPLVLMAMAGGALIIGPLLSYIDTGLTSLRRGSESAERYYAADSGVEHAIWRLKYEGLSLALETPFTYIYSTVNDMPVEVTIVKKAAVTNAQCGDNLPQNPSDKVDISKEVDPDSAPPGVLTTFNYSIQFENIGSSNIHFYEIGYHLPAGFTYVAGSSGGFTVNNPLITDSVVTWGFTSPLPSIEPGQQITQTFQASGALEQGTYCSFCDAAWVIFQPGNIGCVMSSGGERYNIQATAGSTYIQSAIGISGGDVTILSWDVR